MSNTQAKTPITANTPNEDYNTILNALLSADDHPFVSPPASPHKHLISQTTSSRLPTIASLSLHPTIESLLHLLNSDLPSAHFLCRHAEVAPAWESMYVHGILHRIEGDVSNSRCWYGDVKDKDVFLSVWGGTGNQNEGEGEDNSSVPEAAKQGWQGWLSRIERWRDRTNARKGAPREQQGLPDVQDWKKEERLLRETSLWEISRVLKFCEEKFAVAVLQDAKKEFVGRIESGNEEHVKVAQAMVTGGEGWREF